MTVLLFRMSVVSEDIDIKPSLNILLDKDKLVVLENDWFPALNDCRFGRCKLKQNLIKVLEIGENCINECEGDLVVENYPNLQSIIVKKNSLKNFTALKMCNCEN